MARAWDWDGPGDGTAGSPNPSQSVSKAVDDAINDGILWVNSAGNERVLAALHGESDDIPFDVAAQRSAEGGSRMTG